MPFLLRSERMREIVSTIMETGFGCAPGIFPLAFRIHCPANAFDEDVKACLQAGMDAHLSKPVDIDKLKIILGRLLAGQ